MTAWDGSIKPGGKLPGPFQGVQDTAHNGAASVGSHTSVTVNPDGSILQIVYKDSTGNPHHKSRAELVVSQANSGVVEGKTVDYFGTIIIPGAPFNQKIAIWRRVWQMDSNFQFAGPALSLIDVGGKIHWGLHMWTGTAKGARGMKGVNPADLGPVVYDVPVAIMQRVIWSKTNKGACIVSFNGKQVFSIKNVQTMPSDGVKQYWKIGPYQDDGVDGSQIVSNLRHT